MAGIQVQPCCCGGGCLLCQLPGTPLDGSLLDNYSITMEVSGLSGTWTSAFSGNSCDCGEMWNGTFVLTTDPSHDCNFTYINSAIPPSCDSSYRQTMQVWIQTVISGVNSIWIIAGQTSLVTPTPIGTGCWVLNTRYGPFSTEAIFSGETQLCSGGTVYFTINYIGP